MNCDVFNAMNTLLTASSLTIRSWQNCCDYDDDKDYGFLHTSVKDEIEFSLPQTPTQS